jgi:prepilin-type N-terminal cleavage/methylation domain-containing protein/prepilin-type processing-associated H-X9-DG protein
VTPAHRTPAPDAIRRRRGFTLIELLAVLSIVGLLCALLLPAVHAAREAARRAGCSNNLRQMGLALQGYHDARGSFPMGYVASSDTDPYVTSPGWGWAAMILPHLEQAPLFASANFGLPVERPENFTTRVAALDTYTCPADRNPGLYTATDQSGAVVGVFRTNSYAACYGAGLEIDDQPSSGNGLFRRNLVVRLSEVRDGSSSTIAVGERGACLVRTPWCGAPDGAISMFTPNSSFEGYPAGAIGRGAELVVAHVDDVQFNAPGTGPDDFYSPHPLGGNFLFADGSVRFVRDTVDLAVLRALCTRDLGEVVGSDAY